MVRVILAGIVVVGFGFALAALVIAPKTYEGVTAALVAGAIPFLIGTVALGSAGIMERVDTARDQMVAAIRAGNEIATNEQKDRKRFQDPTQQVKCTRCGNVVPAGKTIASSRGPICDEGCERDARTA